MQQQNILNSYISEVFLSIQGEGKYVGARQLFIRFSGCGVNCNGCDTDYNRKESFEFLGKKFFNPVDIKELSTFIKSSNILKEIHSISFTGGEPLLNDHSIEFIIDFLGDSTKYFLETNGFYLDRLEKIYKKLDIVSIDIKLNSTFDIRSNVEDLKNANFIEHKKSYFKLVIDKNINHDEIKSVIEMLKIKKFYEIYLHFKNNLIEFNLLDAIMKIFYSNSINVYYVPQTHKLMGFR
jgi:organic radical activating enzyme